VQKLSAGNLKAAEVFLSTENSYWWAAFGRSSQTHVMPLGACGNTWGEGLPAQPDPGSLFDAGAALKLQAPHAAFSATRSQEGGYNGPFVGVPESGEYRLDNAGGGPGLAPFQATFQVPSSTFVWTDREAFSTPGPDGFTISWSVADPDAGHIVIYGNLALDGAISGATLFTCAERPDKGSFTIPYTVLERAGVWSGVYNELYVRVWLLVSRPIPIPSLDFAQLFFYSPAPFKVIDAATLALPAPR
jgi:hypothetical protein